MSLRITNISITQPAEAVLRRERARFRPQPGDEFALVYVVSYTNPDGTTVEGFQPGYMVAPWPADHVGSPEWAFAHLPDGIAFHFLPRFKWSARAWYLVDLVEGLFQIGPVPAGRT